MLQTYLKIAWRNLTRNKGYAAINLAGLAIGFACCILIGLFVRNELSYDRFHEEADRIYRVTNLDVERDRHWAPIGPAVGPALERSVPDIEHAVRFTSFGENPVLTIGEHQFEEPDVLYADAAVFDVFTVPLVRGNPEAALDEPYTAVLSEELARRYFGEEDPVGQTLTIGGGIDLTVTGVFEDMPSTTHLPFKVLVSMPTFVADRGDWVEEQKTWKQMWTYVLLRQGHDPEEVAGQLSSFVDRFFEPEGERLASDEQRLILQPLTDIHLHSSLEKEWRANSDIAYVHLFSLIALFVLGIACINFVNLATARSTERAKEVGIQKTVGASRTRLVGQFIAESIALTTVAAVIALFIVRLALPLFQDISGKEITGGMLSDPLVLAGLLSAAVVVGLLAGSYPALLLSRFQPAKVLKGAFTTSAKGAALRKGLVVLQFGIAIAVVAGTFVVHKQMDYLQTKNLGFDKEHILSVRLSGTPVQRLASHDALKEELRQHEAIASVSMASDVPGKRFSIEYFRVQDTPAQNSPPLRAIYGVDHDYLSTLGAELVEGRDFDRERSTDADGAFIINEAAVEALGLDEPVGSELAWSSQSGEVGEIVGVVNNFHFASLHHEVEPLVIYLRPEAAQSFMLIRTQPGKTAEALQAAENTFNRLGPGAPFLFSFLDQDLDQLYRSEARLSQVVTAFSILIVLIACLGLFGLAAFTTERRRKEIGIRKVLGATAPSIVALLSKDFLKLVLIGFVLAAPVAYWSMQRWLEGFAYRIEIGAGIFMWAGTVALITALLTVSYQALRAAWMNPAEAIRKE